MHVLVVSGLGRGVWCGWMRFCDAGQAGGVSCHWHGSVTGLPLVHAVCLENTRQPVLAWACAYC